MSSYTVKTGDTFSTISRRVYGSESYADLIKQGNPGAFEPLTAGTTLIIPASEITPTNKKQSVVSDNPDEVSITIRGKQFRFFNSVLIKRKIDSFDTVSISAPFEPDDKDYREFFRPFKYDDIETNIGGEPVFSGTMVGLNPGIGPSGRIIGATGYSRPGVLNDCTAPANMAPLEFDEATLFSIASKIAAPFGIAVSMPGDAGAPFDRVAAKPEERVFSFLSKLAAQRNIIISNTETGELLLWSAVSPGKPVGVLRQGESPVLNVTPSFNPQEYYSHITGIEPALLFLAGEKYTVKNERLTEKLRPMTYSVNDTIAGDLEAAVKTKAARMFANMAAYDVDVSTWRDPSGNIWRPNTTVKLVAPGAMVYDEYEFVIRSVELYKSGTDLKASLNLIVPGALSGELPEKLPWDL